MDVYADLTLLHWNVYGRHSVTSLLDMGDLCSMRIKEAVHVISSAQRTVHILQSRNCPDV